MTLDRNSPKVARHTQVAHDPIPNAQPDAPPRAKMSEEIDGELAAANLTIASAGYAGMGGLLP